MGLEMIVTIAVSMGSALAVTQWRLSRNEDEDDKQWKAIGKEREWRQEHTVEALNKRIEYEKRFGDMLSTIGKVEIQYIESEKRTAKIEQKIDHLSNQIEKLVEQIARK